MSSSKEVRALLKKAKAAVDKKDFAEALNCCQAVFQLDSSSYHGHVFAGLSSLQLGSTQEARHHYQTAVALQPEEGLAWKGLAGYYDKHTPTCNEETLEAVQTYSKLLGFFEGDLAKRRSTLEKLVALHKSLSQVEDVLSCYSSLLAMTNRGSSDKEEEEEEEGGRTQLWLEAVAYILSVEPTQLTEQAWEMLTEGFQVVSGSCSVSRDVKQETQVKYTHKIFFKFLSGPARSEGVERRVRQECSSLLERSGPSTTALAILTRLTLINAAKAISEYTTPELSVEEHQWLTQLYTTVTAASVSGRAESGGDATLSSSEVEGLGWAGWALVSMVAGLWEEAKSAVDRAVAASGGVCESWLLSACIHLRRHDNASVEQAAVKGLKVLQNAPLFMSSQLEGCFKIHLAQAFREDGRFDQALSLLSDLAQTRSHDHHVTVELVRTYLKLGDVAQAKQLLGKLAASMDAESGVVAALQGEVYFAQKDYSKSVERLDVAMSHQQQQQQQPSARLHFIKGLALWSTSGADKTQAYSSFLQAAKGDPYHAEVFLYLGHYHRLVTKDLSRAIKCYQKAVSLQPSHTEAALELGNVLFATGEEEGAFTVYTKITATVPKTKAKLAWLRMGLYQRKNKLFNDAIKSFQNALSADPEDKHCWECLAEAYFARGSHISALRSFAKCLEFDPNSLYCLYQIASIKQLLGLFDEAVQGYTAALEIDPTYVPALKGRGESKLKLAQVALAEVFDGKAVDCITSALEDLTTAAHLKPSFICLWKLIGDCCVCLHAVDPTIARPCVPKVLTGRQTKPRPSDESEQIEKKELLEIGCRAYGRAIQLSPDSANLWHDLSMGYYHLGQALGEVVPERKQSFGTALKAIKKAISLNQKDHTHWNALGVVASCKDIGNFALAQHAFIRSIQEESNNATAWSNLGVLYLKLDNMKLAHQAFKNGQALDPDHVQCWVGQALIAERVGSTEAMDLFRHSTELGHHPLGGAGYGYWVCQTLNSIDAKLILNPGGVSLNPIALQGMLHARDGLQKYVCREQTDACVHNLLGILLEQEGLLTQAAQSFESAVKLCGESDVLADKLLLAKSNYTRVQSALKVQGCDAVTMLELLCQQDGSNISTQRLELALALFREERLMECFEAYGRCMANGGNPEETSAILTAQAMVKFAQGDKTKCKALLFEAFQTLPPCLHGLVCLCVLGCLTSDYTLMQAALKEIDKNIEWQPDAAALLHPSCVQALHTVSFVLQDKPEAGECGPVFAQVLQRLYSQLGEPESIAISLRRLSKAGLDGKSQLYSVEKLVHSYPSDVWCLSQLTALLPSLHGIRGKYKQLLLPLVDSQLKMVSPKLRPSLHAALISLQKWVAAV